MHDAHVYSIPIFPYNHNAASIAPRDSHFLIEKKTIVIFMHNSLHFIDHAQVYSFPIFP